MALLGANGAGKSTTLEIHLNLAARRARRRHQGRRSSSRATRVDQLTANELVQQGLCQVMEGRHCFAHLTVEENLLTGAFTRKVSRAEIAQALEKVYHYFPRLKTASHQPGRLHLRRRAADVARSAAR